MRPSPSGLRLGPRGYSFSRPQRVHLYYGPVTRSLPWGDLVDRLQSFSFHHLCYPNYGALTSTPAGLAPAEHASLRWTHNRTGRSPASGLYGAFFVKGASRQSGRPLHSILLFDPRREHSFVPTAYLHRRRGAAAVKDGASSAPPKACP